MISHTPPRLKVMLYTPHEGQQLIHRSKARFRIVACGRRWGKTLHACNAIVSFALNHKNANCAWVAPWFKQSKIAYRFIRRAFAKSGNRIIVRKSDSELRFEFANGSVIQFFSAENYEAIRGEGYHFCVIDEAADALRDPKIWTDAIRPALSDTNGMALIIGTPKGRNLFSQLFNRGADPEYPDWESFHAATSDNPYIPREEIVTAKKELPEDTYSQEFDAVFLRESAGVFRGIDACIDGELCDPQPHCDYVVGWDPAKHQDYSVLTVFNCNTRHVDHWERSNQEDYTPQISRVCQVAERYNNAYVLMDMSGVGDPLLEQLQRRGVRADGYLFTNASKKILIDTLVLGFQDSALSFPNIEVLVNELRQMQRTLLPSRLIQYAAPSGAHDDAVISLALAYYASAYPRVPLSGDDDAPSVQEVVVQQDPFKWIEEREGGW